MKVKFLFLALIIGFAAKAQTKYYVYFTDKIDVTFNPHTYFHPKALERRKRCGVGINKTDYPLNQNYVVSIKEIVDSITAESRWLNMVTVWAGASQIEKIKELSFVKQVLNPMPSKLVMAADESEKSFDERYAHFQLERMNGAMFTKNGYTGKGIRIAILDAGFSNANQHIGLKHLKVEATYDFADKTSYVYHKSWHGTGVMGCVGGKLNENQNTGLATGATYLLARTEKEKSEYFSEEENWLAAAEWADKNGADLINSSLGYTVPRYFREQMDGKSSLVAQAAQMAFRKGIVVLTSAGNEGGNSWKYIGSPADGDSVLGVGGIDAYIDRKISFSSYGPSADGRIKPNIVALGMAVSASNQGFETMNGTSFSSPLATGFVACYMQANPGLTQHEIFENIQKAGHLYPYFDYVHGYGVPVAWKALNGDNPWPEGDGQLVQDGDKLILEVDEKYFFEVCNADSGQLRKKNIYMHVENEKGQLSYYAVLHSINPKTTILDLTEYPNAAIIRVHFEGKTLSYTLR